MRSNQPRTSPTNTANQATSAMDAKACDTGKRNGMCIVRAKASVQAAYMPSGKTIPQYCGSYRRAKRS